MVVGLIPWICHAIAGRRCFCRPTRNLRDLLLFDIPSEGSYDRIIRIVMALLFGIVVARMLDRQIAGETKPKRLTEELQPSRWIG